MKIIYIHGLDSSAQSVKGQLLDEYCRVHYPHITVLRPDLNMKPAKVFETLCGEISGKADDVMVMGSSLGGYFASLVSNATGCPAVLLNPSTQPHLSLKRFMSHFDLPNNVNETSNDGLADTVIYKTSGGWDLTYADLMWFAAHKLDSILYPQRVIALIKEGDELLDAKVAIEFYNSQGVIVIAQEGGDHRMTDFAEQLPLIFATL